METMDMPVRDKSPECLFGRCRLAWTVTLTALFSAVFLFLVSPLCRNLWLGTSSAWTYLLSVAFAAVSAAIVSVDRFLMLRAGRSGSCGAVTYVLWLLAEIVCVAAVYACLTQVGRSVGVVPQGDGWIRVFLGAALAGLVCIGFPAAAGGFASGRSNGGTVVRLTDFSDVVSDAPQKPYEDKRITLFDSNGVLKISINEDNLYFIESDDNYIKVWYTISTGEVRQYMLRCPLKTVEDSFAGSVLVRCHRKFIVNIDKVCILRSEKEGYKITLGLEGVDSIPISKTYEQNVLSRFNSRY